jgi:RimJ/RimL family protein N-acetyltransferase
MRLVKATYIYWDFIRQLRIKNEVQDGFITKVKSIDSEQHTKYMAEHWNDFYVCLSDEKGFEQPVGYVGLKQNLIYDYRKEITYCVEPEFQNKGYGFFMIKEILNKKVGEFPFAYILKDNVKSIKVFDKVLEQFNLKDDKVKFKKQECKNFIWFYFDGILMSKIIKIIETIGTSGRARGVIE